MSDSSIKILIDLLVFVIDLNKHIDTGQEIQNINQLCFISKVNNNGVYEIWIRDPEKSPYGMSFYLNKDSSLKIDIPDRNDYESYNLDTSLIEFVKDLKEMDRNMFKLTHNFDINLLEIFSVEQIQELFDRIKNYQSRNYEGELS